MMRPARLLLASCLAATAASVSGFATGAEGVEAQQELVNVKVAKHVLSAAWMRLPDSYTLQVVIDRSMPAVMVDIPAALRLLPQNVSPSRPQPIPLWQEDAPYSRDRGSQFIAETIANLRNLDVSLCGRTLTIDDGRRTAPAQRAEAPGTIPLPPGFWDNRVQVWLLNAGGALIQNATYLCDDPGRNSPDRSDFLISYGYSLADGAQAVAAAIRIGDEFYIEKLKPLTEPAQP
jgi:hypothetical protein